MGAARSIFRPAHVLADAFFVRVASDLALAALPNLSLGAVLVNFVKIPGRASLDGAGVAEEVSAGCFYRVAVEDGGRVDCSAGAASPVVLVALELLVVGPSLAVRRGR